MAAHITLLPHNVEDTEGFANNLSSMAQKGAAGFAKARAAAPGLMAKANALGGRAQALGGRAQALGGRLGAMGKSGVATARSLSLRGPMTPRKAAAIKSRFGKWLAYRPPNITLLLSNLLYLGLTTAVLILTLLIMKEHSDDLTRNSFEHFSGADEPVPCGMATPDGLKLLQSLGTVGAGGWVGATLEPDYKAWMLKIDRAICSKVVVGINPSTIPNGYLNVANAPAEHAHELLALSYLLDDNSIRPTKNDVLAASPATLQGLENKRKLFEERACMLKKDPEKDAEPFYTEQQDDAYGDLKVRVARAYVAAMPAFARYKIEKETCAEDAGTVSPFDEFCTHASFIKAQLDDAAMDGSMMIEGNRLYDASVMSGGTGGVTFTKMFYRLLALSLAGYHDRHLNRGRCFKNDANMPAIDLCHAVASGIGTVGGIPPGDDPMKHYADQQGKIVGSMSCEHLASAPPPPPPTPPITRISDAELMLGYTATNAGTDSSAWEKVCASTLQYGLFEQGRLFGIPDPTGQFVVDNRADRALHFIAGWIYSGLYINPWKNSGDIVADPKARLEVYMAYRLASTTIWGMLVANVCGFLFARAAVPLGVYCLRLAQVRAQGNTAIVLMRPRPDVPLYITLGVTVLVIYWLIWIDPAVQSHYPVTTQCDEWQGLGVLVPHGAYVTTWGKRRFDRLGEYIIGYLLLLTLGLCAFQQLIGRNFVSKERRARNSAAGKLGTSARQLVYFYLLLGLGIGVETCFAVQAGLTGEDWHEAAQANDQTNALAVTLWKDCTMAVWAAFWISAGIGSFRQKWTIQDLDRKWKIAWIAGTCFLFAVPVIQGNVLLSTEINLALQNGRGTADPRRNTLLWFTWIITATLYVPLAIKFRQVLAASPVAPKAGLTAEAIATKKRNLTALLNDAGVDMTSACQVVSPYDISGATMHPSVMRMARGPATGNTGRGAEKHIKYFPLLPIV